MNKPVILIVDDEVSNIEIVCAALESDYEISFALSGDQALDIAHAAAPDLVLLDIVMPGLDGYEVCRRFKSDPVLADIPVIFTTALDGTDAEVRGLSVGAIDYVTKPFQPVALRQRVGNHVEMKRMRDQLSEMAMKDPLTGLGNRRLLERQLQAELRRLSRDRNWLSVIMMDIDFFKRFNDSYGHPAGDRCLEKVAEVLERATGRGGDLAVRYGGEEFACVLPDTDYEGALSVAEIIRHEVEAMMIPHVASSVSAFVTISVGLVSDRCIPGSTMTQWLSAADRMLYRSKELGRNRVTGQLTGGGF